MSNKLSITAIKRADNLWHFDHEAFNTKEELLCNGTEKVIDIYFQHLNNKAPKFGDTIKFFLSIDQIEADTTLSFIDTNETGTTYYDEVTRKIVWLCPWLQKYFGHKPKIIYVKVEK